MTKRQFAGEARRPRGKKKARVRVVIDGVQHVWTVEEAIAAARYIIEATHYAVSKTSSNGERS